MARNPRPLVVTHLERISSDVLVKYKELIREHARGQNGIYALYNGRTLYYVGLASSLSGRLNGHLKDRHKGRWTHFSMYITDGDHYMRELEALLIRVAAPGGNRQKGRLAGSESLLRCLRDELARQHREELERLGFRTPRPVQTRNGHRSLRRTRRRRTADIAARFPRAIWICGTYKGDEHWARLRTNGTVRFNGTVYKTLGEAAAAARGRPCNGLWFWHYEKTPGNWQRLRTLRR